MLAPVIGELLPSAVGVALSPVPIVAVVLMLATPRGRANGSAFAVGWVAGLVAVSAVVLVLTSGASEDSTTSDAISWGRVALGALLVGLGAAQWRKRPRPGEEPSMPSWMSAIDTFTPVRSLLLGAALSGVNPKNLALTASAAATISLGDLGTGGTVAAVAVFVVLGSVTVVGPAVVALVAPAASRGALEELRRFMAAHNAVIMMVVLIVLGVKVLGQGLGVIG